MRWLLLLLWLSWPAPSLGQAADFSQEILAIHNRERARVGVPPLVWSATLATGASAYARQLAPLGRLQHSSRDVRPGIGENLAMGAQGVHSTLDLVELWVAEKAAFRNGTFPDVSTTGAWRSVGHYTAMIWRTTTSVGCGTAAAGRNLYLVCRYSPSGNVIGRAVY